MHASLMRDVSNVEVGHKATGLGGVVGNKGAVAVSLRLRDTALCFVNAHLAARPERVEERNSNFAGIRVRIGVGVGVRVRVRSATATSQACVE